MIPKCHDAIPWFHISLERKYEKLNRSGETESDFWNLQFLPPTRRLSIVSWAIRHQKENDCSACVGDVAIFKTRYSLTPTIKHSSYLTTAAVNIFNLLAKTMITDSRSDWFALLTRFLVSPQLHLQLVGVMVVAITTTNHPASLTYIDKVVSYDHHLWSDLTMLRHSSKADTLSGIWRWVMRHFITMFYNSAFLWAWIESCLIYCCDLVIGVRQAVWTLNLLFFTELQFNF